MKWHEWQTALLQLIPSQWSTAQQLAANAVQATQQVIQEQVLAMTEATSSPLQDAVQATQQVITDQVAAMTHTEVTTQIHDAVQATQQLVTDQVTMTQTEVTTQLHDLQDTIATTAAQVTVAAQQSGIEMAAQFQDQLHESMSQVDDTVLLAANAVAAAKATADVSFAALEQWLPGYTATVHAILMERAAALSAVLGSAVSEQASWSQLLQQQQALVLELLFQLKSTMHAKLDAMLLSTANVNDNTVLVQQMAAANAQLKILQDSLLTTSHNAVATSSKTQQALEFLTSSTQEKLAVVSLLLLDTESTGLLLASPPPNVFRNGAADFEPPKVGYQ